MPRRLRLWFLAGAVALSACSVPPPDAPPGTVHDPYERFNRRVHEFNKELDRSLLKPLSEGYTRTTNDEVELIIYNVANNLSMPGVIVNRLLQGRFESALRMTIRFAFNTVFGIGGMADLATAGGLPQEHTDFGETLHVWGFAEGAYVELPVLGPSTERDAAGKVVDFVLDPLGHVMNDRQRWAALGIKAVAGVGARGRFASTVDSVLYESADSYSQLKLLYLQNRRFELAGGETTDYILPDEVDTEGF